MTSDTPAGAGPQKAGTASGPELQVRLGQPPAAFRLPVREHRGGLQVLDTPGAGEFDALELALGW
jgi:hypothetical protein